MRELAKYKTKPIRDISSWEVLWFNDIPVFKGFSLILDEQKAEIKEHIWLDIHKPKEPKKPQIPTICKEWIENSEDDSPLSEPHLKSQISDNADITFAYNEYINLWRTWAEDFKSWQTANAVYEKLFYINQELKKRGEQYELIIGIGLLTWETPKNQVIKRHIIVGDAELIFYPERASFQLQGASEGGTKLRFELDMLEPTDVPSQDIEKRISENLKDVSENPWAKDEIDIILKSWIQAMNANGIYSDSITAPLRPTKQPILTFAPALILRKRTQQSQIQCFDTIVNNITDSSTIPIGIAAICDIEGDSSRVSNDDDITNSNSGKEIYMPLPINEEQKKILERLNRDNGVLVQGPPGTGKSYTIANLICHLMATGKRILVTSQTPRALKVLKRFIPKDLQALCVSLLGNNQDALKELQDCVQGINKAYSDWNPVVHSSHLSNLTKDLEYYNSEIVRLTGSLRAFREKDATKYAVADGHYSGTGQDVANKIRLEEKELGWIPDIIDEYNRCPLSNIDFKELLRLYRKFPEDYCTQLSKKLFNISEILDANGFINLFTEEEKLKSKLVRNESFVHTSNFELLAKLDNNTRTLLKNAIVNISTYVDNINNQFRFRWIHDSIQDMLRYNITPWKNLFSYVSPQLDDLEQEIKVISDISAVIPNTYNHLTVSADACALLSHISKGGSMGWGFFKPSVVKKGEYIMNTITVNGSHCNTVDNLTKLIQYIQFHEKMDRIWGAFKNIDDRIEGSIVMQLGYLKERKEALSKILDIETHLKEFRILTRNISGFIEPRWQDKTHLTALISELDIAEIKYSYQKLLSKIYGIEEKIKEIISRIDSHELNHEMLKAIETRDTRTLADCLDKAQIICTDKGSLQMRTDLYNKLSLSAPMLASKIGKTYSDSCWDVFAQSFEAAWNWKRTNNWISNLITNQDISQIESRLTELELKKVEILSNIAAMKAWEHCLNNLTETQRQSLIAWALEIKRIGKGTGKHAPKHRKRAQEYMDSCKDAIPAWIMPLHRVFQTVTPQPGIYDVVIIDEASQTGPEGLIIRYLGKKCIIVGDNEQISPEEVGIDETEVDSIISKYLNGIPHQFQYDPKMSLFDHAMKFRNRIQLREHFRCMPEIIQFSNQLCYTSSPLIPLRLSSPNRLEPILTYYISDGRREGDSSRAINEPEATALVNKVVECCKQDRYNEKTMGIISLQGEEQAKLIQKKLHDQIDSAEWERRKIICGDAYAFQGDERDIIFLSMVAASNMRPVAFVRDSFKQRFNVAASRAKDQMILFHSVNLTDLSPDCYRYKLLKYCLNPGKAKFDGDISKIISPFEKEVYEKIVSKGYRVVPQFEIAGYFIDLMIFGDNNRLAVECDSAEWHGPENWEKDAYRQRQLERCGVRFYRIWGTEFYRQPDISLQKLWTTLEDMGIYPQSAATFSNSNLNRIAPNESNNVKNIPIETMAIKTEEANITNSSQPDKPSTSSSKPLDSTESITSDNTTGDAPGIAATSDTFDIYSKPPKFYFNLAHWGKDTDKLVYWERAFIFNIGKLVAQNYPLSDKQKTQCFRIVQQAYNNGFKYPYGET